VIGSAAIDSDGVATRRQRSVNERARERLNMRVTEGKRRASPVHAQFAVWLAFLLEFGTM
jgi:hypothetical protein